MEKGCIQLFLGDGKGKTCAAVGSAIRACGSGRRVVFFQFLKDGSSSETDILKKLDGITVVKGPENVPFFFNCPAEVIERFKAVYKEKTDEINGIMASVNDGMLVLDELIDAMNIGFVSADDFCNLVSCTKNGCEVVITGHEIKTGVSDIAENTADYISYIKKIKHPFDCGISARRGVEF